MKRLYVLLVSALSLLAADASAQGMLNADKRKMNMAVLQTLDRFETLSAPADVNQAEALVSMFRDPSMLVFNDLMEVSQKDRMTVAEYVSALQRLKGIKVSFTDIVKSEPYVSAGSLCVTVNLKKAMTYYNDKSVYYSSEDFFGAPLDVTVVFSYDDFDGTCLIESLDGNVSQASSARNDILVMKYQPYLSNIRFRKQGSVADGRYYQLNDSPKVDFGNKLMAFLPKSAASEDWYYMQDIPYGWDPDVFAVPSVSADGFLSLGKKHNPFRVMAYNSTTLAGAYHVEGELDKVFSIADEAGVEVRFMPDFGNRLNAGIYGGLGVSYTYLDVAVRDLDYQYRTSGEKPYVRQYDFDHIGQRYSMVDGVLFGGVVAEYALFRRWTVEAKLGGKAYYNIHSKVGNIYCDYKVLESDGTIDRIRGHFKAENVVNQHAFEPDVWPCPLSAVAGAGMNLSLSKSLQLSFGLEYEYGLNYYYSSSLKSYKEYKYPVMLSSTQNIDEAHWMFNDSFHLKRRALWLDLGLIYKFSFKK